MATLYRRFINEMYIHGYSLSEEAPTFRVPENFDKYRRGPGWQAYQGANDWESGTTGVAIYLNPEGYKKEMARIWFEVKYPDHLDHLVGESMSTNRPEYREIQKWGRKGSIRWIRETERIRKSTRKFHGVHDGYAREWVERKPWKECFILALQSDRMKPFVKEYGVDHTKWVGMKRCELNESGTPSKFWWMDPEGELIPVPKFGHAGVGTSILKKKFGVETENTFTELQARGYIRVGFTGLWSQYFIEINHNRDKPPTATQWRALKDLAIELGADSIDDNTTGLKVRVDESRLLFENFHENKEWFVYEGTNTVTTIFEDNSRQTFKLHFHDKRLSEDRDKVRKKAANTWKRLAKEIRDSAGLNKVGNPIIIPWQECFQRALKHPDILEFIDDLRATPIFEAYGWFPMYNVWLSPDGKPYKGGSHESIGTTYLRSIEKEATGTRAVYNAMYGMGFVRVVVGDNMYPLIVDSGRPGRPKLTGEQREWIENKSFELGLNGEYSSADGRNFVAEGLNEMTYDDLRNSMKSYRSKSDMRKGTTTGSDSRERGAKDVRAKSLRVISTVGKDGNEHETSLFSYKSYPTNRDPRVQAEHPRWQGFIRFVESKQGTTPTVAPPKERQDVEVNCTCFSGNTGVLMSDGTYKSIKDIKPGDFVYTHKGRIRPVIGNSSRKPKNSESVYKIRIAGFPDDIIVTGSHPFYTLRGNTICRCGCGTTLTPQIFKSLNPRSVLSRRYNTNHHPNKNWRKEINLLPDENPFQWIKVDDFKKREWFLSPWVAEGPGGSLDGKLARFLGYYAAEGNIPNRDDVRFCFNLSELETLGKDSIDIANVLYRSGKYFRLPKSVNGVQGNLWKIYKMNGASNKRKQNCFNITFHITKEFKSFIETNIGCGSKEKKLSPWFMSLNNETLKHFIVGLFLGDGTIKQNGYFRWTSISKVLVYNVSTILRKLKIDHVITNIGDGLAIDVYHGNSSRQIFDWLRPYLRTTMLERKNENRDREEYHLEEGSLKVLRNIEKIEYNGDVWDLCVEEDHSFIVAGIAVANCPDYKYVWAKANSDRDAGVTGADTLFKAQGGFKGGGNDNNNTMGKRIRNPNNTPGLCIAGGELISTQKGFIPIENIVTGDSVWTLNGWKEVTNSGCTGKKEIAEIKLGSGRVIKLTPEHKVLSFNEEHGVRWVDAGLLTSSDFLCLTLPPDVSGSQYSDIDVPEYTGDKLHYPSNRIKLDNVLAELMGYMIAEGSEGGVFSNFDERLKKDFNNKWCHIFGEKSCIIRKGGCYIGTHGAKILERIGFICGSYKKEVPTWIMKGNVSIVTSFLRGCYAGDGNFRNHHSTYATVSEKLARNIHLLIGFTGVKSTIRCYKSGVNKSLTWVIRTSSQEQTEKLYNILSPIRGYSTIDNITPVQKHFCRCDYVIKNGRKFIKNSLLTTLKFEGTDKIVPLTECNKYFDWLSPSETDTLASILKKRGVLEKIKINTTGKRNNAAKLSDIFDALKPYYIRKIQNKLGLFNFKQYKIHQFNLIPVIEQLKLLAPPTYYKISLLSRKDVSFEKVMEVKHNNSAIDVYDLTVDTSEHFTVNGIVVHNCKHLIAVAEYIEGKVSQVAPADSGEEEPDQVAPKQSKLKKTGKPINIFEQIRQFALANPAFDVPYED